MPPETVVSFVQLLPVLGLLLPDEEEPEEVGLLLFAIWFAAACSACRRFCSSSSACMNAITGKCEYYEDVPSWVDRVYSAELITEQYNYHGTYQNGWLNSFIGQKGVTVTTEGYNYIAKDDDVYMLLLFFLVWRGTFSNFLVNWTDTVFYNWLGGIFTWAYALTGGGA